MLFEEIAFAVLSAASQVANQLTDHYLLERRLKAALGRPAIFHPNRWRNLTAGNGVPIHLFFPQDVAPSGVLLFFHGGGWTSGGTESYARVCQVMAQITRRCVVSVDYRLAPEHPFPAGLDDCYSVTESFYTHPSRWGIRGQDIVLIGDSAGANLCAAVSLRARDTGDFLPTAQILLYPALWNDYSENSPFPSLRENGQNYLLTARRLQDYMSYYAPQEEKNNTYVAPLLCRDLSRQPPTLLFSAEHDPLRDEGETYAAALRRAGNQVECFRVPNALHGYFSLSPRVPIVRMTYGRINRFLKNL